MCGIAGFYGSWPDALLDAMLNPGAVCFADSQCISGDCQGPDFKMCIEDGRTCDGEEDCPVESTCATVGVADGICQ